MLNKNQQGGKRDRRNSGSDQRAESVVVSSKLVRQQLQNEILQPQIQFSGVDTIEEKDIIYKDYIYDKFLLSPLEKYQKYGKFPMKMCVHIFLVLLTTSQILYSSNTLSTNSTEQYEQWRLLFFQENSNKNIKNQEFENKMMFYTTVQKFQNQLSSMFEEMNKNNTNRIQDVYFNYTDIELKVYYNYPMDPYILHHPIDQDPEDDADGEKDNVKQHMEDHDSQTMLKAGQKSNCDDIQKLGINNNQNECVSKLNQAILNRDFYQELSFNMDQDLKRLLFNKTKPSKANFNKQVKQKTYKQVQLVFPVNREDGIVEPFNMDNITQIKQIFQFTDHISIQMNNVILIKSNLVSCWEFIIDYNLYGHASIRALLGTEGGVCTDDLFNKGVQLHEEEYKDSFAFKNKDEVDDQNNQKFDGESLNNKDKEDEQFKKRQLMKVRGTRYKTSKSNKNGQKREASSKRNKKQSQNTSQKTKLIGQQLLEGKSEFYQHIHHYEKNGNLYKSGNLLFIGFNTFIDVMTLIFSTLSLFLSLKYLVQIIELYIQTFKKSTKVYIEKDTSSQLKYATQKHKSKYLTLQRILAEQRPWQELSLWDKLSYFDFWFFVILMGNLFQLVGSFYLISLDSQSVFDQRTEVINWTVGLGCFCSWFSLMKYLEYSKSLALILDVLKFALPELFKVLIEFSLVYLSFIIIGMTSFWQSERFADFRSTATTLFGLVMADSIYDVIQDCEDNGVLPNFMAQIYVILFVLMFIICVTNIMIGILEDGYSRNKQEHRFQRKIQNINNEQQRAVISKLVKKEETIRGNIFSRRQGSFESDDGIKYGKNKQGLMFSPQVQSQFLMSPHFSNLSQNKSLTTSPVLMKSNSKQNDKQKMSPLVQMKMVANAGIAIQRAKKFVQIKKKEKQELQEKATISNPIGGVEEKLELERDRSLFDESSQPIFKIISDEKEGEQQEQSELDISADFERAYSQRRILKSKTLQNFDQKPIDENSSESDNDDNKELGIRKIESEIIDEEQNSQLIKSNIKSSPRKITFSDESQIFGQQQEQFVQTLSVIKKLSPSQVFRKELEILKNKEIFVEQTAAIFNNCYKQLKHQLEESQKLMINSKFFQISKSQKKEITNKYSQYLFYFQQRISAALLELDYFQIE